MSSAAKEQRKLAKNTDVKFTRARLKRAEATDCYTSNTTHHPASDSAEQNRSSWTRAKGSQFANRNEMGEEREEHRRGMDSSAGRRRSISVSRWGSTDAPRKVPPLNTPRWVPYSYGNARTGRNSSQVTPSRTSQPSSRSFF